MAHLSFDLLVLAAGYPRIEGGEFTFNVCTSRFSSGSLSRVNCAATCQWLTRYHDRSTYRWRASSR